MTNHSGAALDIQESGTPKIGWVLACADQSYYTDLSPFAQVSDGQTITARLQFDVPSATHRCILYFWDYIGSGNVQWDLSI
jgi:hypothetical protein